MFVHELVFARANTGSFVRIIIECRSIEIEIPELGGNFRLFSHSTAFGH